MCWCVEEHDVAVIELVMCVGVQVLDLDVSELVMCAGVLRYMVWM